MYEEALLTKTWGFVPYVGMTVREGFPAIPT
jgi:hypothetical protein